MIEASGTPWVAIGGFSIPAAVTLVGGWLTWRASRHNTTTQRELERLRVSEARVSERKERIYEPILETFRKMVDGETPTDPNALKVYWSNLLTVASDDAFIAFARLTSASFQMPLPGMLLFRFYTDFVLAARRDMGDPDSTLDAITAISPIIRDAYDNRTFFEDMALPLETVYAKYAWTPPWETPVESMNDDRHATIAAYHAALNEQAVELLRGITEQDPPHE